MLKRVLEPEVMDSLAEAEDYDSMDHRAVNRVFVADFIAFWNGRGPILDVGTGTGQIPIEFCAQSAAGDILAIDLAEQMLLVARQKAIRLHCDARLQFERVNAREMPYADGKFAALMSNSIVHHIPEPRAVFAEMVRVSAPGATLFVRDLLRPVDLAMLNRLVTIYAVGANDHQRKMFSESLHAALTLDEVRDIVAELGFDRDTVRQTSDRHWTWSALRS